MNKNIKSFCKHCTLHGVYYFYSSPHWWVHVIWSIIILSSTGLCCFLGHMIWEKFAINPTLTVVESTHYSISHIPFPAVTVCDTETVYGPNTDDITELLVLRGFNLSQIHTFYKSFSSVRQNDYKPESYVRKMHSLLEDLGYPLNVLLNMFKKPCNDLIVECNWRSQPHNCSAMFRSIYTVAGFCCQFDIPYFRKHTPKATNFLSGVEVTDALDIFVNGQTSYADGNVTNGNALLYIFDDKNEITLVDSSITVTPGAFFDVNVFVWAIDSSDNVRSLPLRSRKCVLETDPGVGATFYQGCMSRLIMREVVNHCRCLPFEYTAKELEVEDYATCNWDRLICIYQTLAKVQIDIRDIISENECYQRCDYVQYDFEVEYVKNQRQLSVSNATSNRVSVHFGQTTCFKYRREVLYTWDQMLANLGGIFGLCLGGSIISVLELIWFLFDLIFAVVATVRKKKVTPKEKDVNKIFTLSHKDWMKNKRSEKTTVGRFKFVH